MCRIKNKAAEDAKAAPAAKRSSLAESGCREDLVQDTKLAPADKASLDEIIMKIVSELASEADEVRRVVTLLGIVYDYPAKAIEHLLKQERPSEQPPSQRTIQLWLKEKREALRSRYGEIGMLGEEPS